LKKETLTTRQKEGKKINRKRAVRQWWKVTYRRFFIISIALFLVSAISFGIWLKRSNASEVFSATISNKFWQLTAHLGFKVENVYLEGRELTPIYEISKATKVKTDEAILSLNIEEIRKSLEEIPRIKSASVERILPNQLHIHITERKPIALWQNDGKTQLIDSDGVAMDYINPKEYQNLMLIVGEGAAAHANELLTIITAESEIYQNIAAVQRIGERRWNIKFKNGVELKLPEKKFDEAWNNFVKMQKEGNILDRSIKSVDMRIYDRLFIKTIPLPKEPEKISAGSDT
jgi:cell division protein FtsQ